VPVPSRCQFRTETGPRVYTGPMISDRSRVQLIFVAALSCLGAYAQAPAPSRVDAAFQKFWAAGSPEQAAKLSDDILKTGVSFDGVLSRMKAGRAYAAQKAGVIQLSNRTSDGVEHFYSVNVPASYDPARRYQMRFQLHGGVGGRSDNKPRGTGEIGALAGAEQFYVLPYSWNDAPWWSDDQILNLDAIVDSLKRTYNIDENRVALSGVSDGATGAYYIAMRLTTPFSSFLPLNGFIMVLADDSIDDHRVFPSNLRNKPFFVVNGGKDRLYPTWAVEPYTKHLMRSGVEVEYHPQPEGEHNTKWWPEIKDPYEQFVSAHPRNPDPDKLSWQAADSFHNRAHWLVIDQFSAGGAGDAQDFADINVVKPDEFPLYDQSEGGVLFAGQNEWGRVDLARTGNTVQATTKGVAAFTLLLSPDKFDFAQPVKVVANGREVFNAKVTPSVKTLLKWAAKDNDRTMLYAAEVQIRLTK
jgi:hypothetical protein